MSESIFTVQTPVSGDVTDATQYTLGTEWSTDIDGTCAGIRVYTSVTEPSAPLVGVLYRIDTPTTGTELARKTASGWITTSWNTITFDTPVAVTAGQRYCAAYVTPDRFVLTQSVFGAPIVNGHLTAHETGVANARNARLHVGDGFPENAASSQANYFADLLFDVATASGVVAATLPALTVETTGTLTLSGAVGPTLPALTVETTGTGAPAAAAPAGSWWQLKAIYDEARSMLADDRARPRSACPNDGEPLVTGPNGELFCPYDGWREGGGSW